MDINNLIEQYGYVTLLLGSLAEGETVTLLGGVAAHEGLLRFPLVVLVVALGGMIGDQALYLVGRRFGTGRWRAFPASKADSPRAGAYPAPSGVVCHRHPLYVRFSYYRPAVNWREPRPAEALCAAEYPRGAGLGDAVYHAWLRGRP